MSVEQIDRERSLDLGHDKWGHYKWDDLAWDGGVKGLLIALSVGSMGGLHYLITSSISSELVWPLIVRAYTLVLVTGFALGAIARGTSALTPMTRTAVATALMTLVGIAGGVFGVTQISTMTIPYPGSPALIACIATSGIGVAWLGCSLANLRNKIIASAIPGALLALISVPLIPWLGTLLRFESLARHATTLGNETLGAIAGGCSAFVCAVWTGSAAGIEAHLAKGRHR